jgi:AAA15 family ATPase/GTPase
MLIDFSVANFKSFKDKQILSMVASSDKSLPGNTIASEALGRDKLVRSAVVYGANASGKSNLVDAIRFVESFVRDSANRNPDTRIGVKPFLLDEDCAKSPSCFEVSFIREDVRYQYGFSVDSERVYEEWLVAYPKGRPQTWFERPVDDVSNADKWYFGPRLRGEKKKLVALLRPDVLFLSLGTKFAHRQLSKVSRWFSDCLRHVEGRGFPDAALMEYTAGKVLEDEVFRKAVTSLLGVGDLGICGIDVTPQRYSDAGFPIEVFAEETRALIEKKEFLKVTMRHEGPSGREISFAIDDESQGTRRLFCMSGPWIYAFSHGCTLVVDEIDASLHPELVRVLIQLFHDANVNQRGAQLVFNTHDTTQLDNSVFRRDQIWFVEKDDSGASHLYPLLEFRPRKDEALEKGYLQGRYGAVPFIGSLEGYVFDAEAQT